MTNGEKLEEVFPDGICPFSKAWLDSEYKQQSDPKLLEQYGNKLVIDSLIYLKARIESSMAERYTQKEDIAINDVFEVINKYIDDLEKTLKITLIK